MLNRRTVQNAFESLLLLDEAFISKDDATNPAVAAAINRAFEEHVPSFNYNEQVSLVLSVIVSRPRSIDHRTRRYFRPLYLSVLHWNLEHVPCTYKCQNSL